MNNRGFTLIELLVVVAIIGMLSSVVLSSLDAARNSARVASAQSALQGIHTGLELYHAEHGRYPGGGIQSLCDNGNETELNDASGISEFLGSTAPLDPWGDHYWIDGDYQCGVDTVGCDSNDPGATSGVLLSRGPDGAISYGNGDDIVIVQCKR